MRPQTREFVDAEWADLFGVPHASVWSGVSVRPHDRLGDYEGFLVAWRGRGAHVSVPAHCPPEVAESLATQGIHDLQSPEFWGTFAESRSLAVMGPSTHHYLDRDPGNSSTVVRIKTADLGPLRRAVTADEWEESGLEHEAEVIFGFLDGSEILAAANLTTYADAPRDVGVLVAPAVRGRRLVDEVGRAAASYAVSRHGLARWRALTTNRGSTGAARRLGFEPWCTQLAIR